MYTSPKSDPIDSKRDFCFSFNGLVVWAMPSNNMCEAISIAIPHSFECFSLPRNAGTQCRAHSCTQHHGHVHAASSHVSSATPGIQNHASEARPPTQNTRNTQHREQAHTQPRHTTQGCRQHRHALPIINMPAYMSAHVFTLVSPHVCTCLSTCPCTFLYISIHVSTHMSAQLLIPCMSNDMST